MKRKPMNSYQQNLEWNNIPEQKTWNSGFNMFKRRINELLQLSGFEGINVEDEELLPFYRMGESENYVLGALGCSAAMYLQSLVAYKANIAGVVFMDASKFKPRIIGCFIL